MARIGRKDIPVDENGCPLPFIFARVGKTDHPAYLISVDGDMSHIIWASTVKEGTVHNSTITKALLGRRRRQTVRYSPPEVSSSNESESSFCGNCSTKPKRKKKNSLKRKKITNAEKVPVMNKRVDVKSIPNEVISLSDSSDDQISHTDDEVSLSNSSDDKKSLTDDDVSFSDSSDDQKSLTKKDVSFDSASEGEDLIAKRKFSVDTASLNRPTTSQINPRKATYVSTFCHKLKPLRRTRKKPKVFDPLRILTEPTDTLTKEAYDKAQTELSPFLDNAKSSILQQKSTEFREKILRSDNVSSMEVMFLAIEKLRNSKNSVIQNLFDEKEPDKSAIRVIYMQWLPEALRVMKNKRKTIDLKISMRQLREHKAEDLLAEEIILLIPHIKNINNKSRLDLLKDTYGINFFDSVDEVQKLAQDFFIRPLIHACSSVKDHLNALKLGNIPPIKFEKKSERKLNMRSCATQTSEKLHIQNEKNDDHSNTISANAETQSPQKNHNDNSKPSSYHLQKDESNSNDIISIQNSIETFEQFIQNNSSLDSADDLLNASESFGSGCGELGKPARDAYVNSVITLV